MITSRYRYNSLFGVLLLAVATSVASNAAADPFESAAWLRDPVFAGTKPLEVFALHHAKAKGTELQNVHTYFRKEFDLPAKPMKAVLYVTGDDYYKLFANGRFVVQGPEPGYPFAHPYYEIEITHLLKMGRNCLAGHAAVLLRNDGGPGVRSENDRRRRAREAVGILRRTRRRERAADWCG